MTDRREFYKSRRGGTYAVTTCDCCRIDGFRDALFWPRGNEARIRAEHCGLSAGFISTLTLITEREARKRRPGLLQEWRNGTD